MQNAAAHHRKGTLADWGAQFGERAGILEHDNGLSRVEAEAQAVREIYDDLKAAARPLPGILGELVCASQRRFDPEMAQALAEIGLANVRAPMWGVGAVTPEAGGYRPALEDEKGHAALIVPAFAGAGLEDLVAYGMASGRMLTRLGAAPLIGADEVEVACESGQPLLVFNDVLAWLRVNALGCVVLDWQCVSFELEGVETILCSRALAPRLHAATRRCWPRPAIGVPAQQELRHAA